MLIGLLNKYHGILWGEHGKGYRGEFVPEVFGPVLYPVLCKIKALFDPNNRFNPGKLTSPDGSPLKRIELVPMRGELDQAINIDQQSLFTEAMLCNGNGACFNQEPNNVMCPSYKVTKNRNHSPKGRAMLVKEWLREKAKSKDSNKTRLAADNALEAMKGCLGCKGCAGKCPTQVSIPDLRTKFINSYYQDYPKRNLRERALGHIERLLPIAAKFPRVWNFVQTKRFLPSFGVANIPTFKSTRPLLTELAQLGGVEFYSSPEEINQFKLNPVVIFVDVFTGLLNREVLIATIKILKSLNKAPYVILPQVSGKALIVGGYIEEFKQNSERLAKLFNPLLTMGIPVVGLENTIALMFRDEIPKFAKPFAGKVLTLAELLASYAKDIQELIASTSINATLSYRLLPHCTEQALLPSEAQAWQRIFGLFGLSLEVKNIGCCGMAGTYGHLKEFQDNSTELFKLHWQADLADKSKITLATGFSCRSQSEKQIDKEIMHPIQILSQFVS
jgi:Fe-S oxidoreductase